MVTPALERLVIRVLQEAAYSYKPGAVRNVVLFLARNQHCIVPGAVVDYPHLRVLAIIISLPRAGRNSLSIINTLNRKQLGKWMVDGEGRLDYVLEFFYTRRTTPAAFAHALELALLTVRWYGAKQRRQPRLTWRQHRRITGRKEATGSEHP